MKVKETAQARITLALAAPQLLEALKDLLTISVGAYGVAPDHPFALKAYAAVEEATT